jgi:hypothetical protein
LAVYSNLRFVRFIAASSLPAGALLVWVLLLCINAPLLRRRSPLSLGVHELVIIFAMLFTASGLPQQAVGETLVSLCAWPARFPEAVPHLTEYGHEVPPWLVVQDPVALRGFFEGYGPAGGAVPWAAWAAPLGAWTVFALLVLLALYCLSRIFQHRWVYEERVAFPLMQLPLELLPRDGRPGRPLWQNPVMWVGFAIPTVVILLQQAHTYWPWMPDVRQTPSIKIGTDLPAFPGPPLSAFNGFTVSINAMVVGVSYLLSSEVAVSVWLFHLVYWAQVLFWVELGYSPQADATAVSAGRFDPITWIGATEFGGALALAGTLFWPVRRDIGCALRALVPGGPPPGNLSVPPAAVAGFLLANVCLLAWAAAARMNILAAVGFLALLYGISLPLGRLVASGGLVLVDNTIGPQAALYGLVGLGGMSKATHYGLTGQEALYGRVDMGFLAFAANEGKLAADTGGSPRWHAVAVGTGVVLALMTGYYTALVVSYRYGATSFQAWPFNWRVPQMYDRMASFLGQPHRGVNAWTWGGMLAGTAIVLVLSLMNRRFLWWGVSPLGFVIAGTWDIGNYVWSSVFLGWLIAALARRWGGVRVYAALRPLFLGLILGENVTFVLMALLESGVSAATG